MLFIERKIMKTKTVILTLIATTSFARANLIDLTPNGYNIDNPWPLVVTQFFDNYQRDQINLAGANITGNQVTWSPFTIFGDDFFNITPNGATANVSWDLANAQGGYHVGFVLIETNDRISHLYQVPSPDWFSGGGLVTADNVVDITSITFAGSNMIPDDLNVGLMFLGTFVLLMTFRKRIRSET
jgi:hypothetical protein